MKVRTRYIFVLLLVFAGCGLFRSTPSYNDDVVLTGEVKRNQLFTNYSWLNSGYEEYTPDERAVQYLASAEDEVRYVVYFGTWCEDTQQLLPQFFKVMDRARIAGEKVQLYALNLQKQQAPGIEDNNILFVPTFIVMMDGKEAGRIVEQPDQSIEQDLADIILSAKAKR